MWLAFLEHWNGVSFFLWDTVLSQEETNPIPTLKKGQPHGNVLVEFCIKFDVPGGTGNMAVQTCPAGLS